MRIREKKMKLLPTTKWAKVRLALLLALLFYIVVPPLYGMFNYKPKEGDIIFQSLPFGELTKVIEGVTNSPYSHVGLMVKKNNRWYVREAIGEVKDTSLYMWILRGRKDSFSVFRLKEAYQKNIPAMMKKSREFLGYPYDIHYELDDKKIYCSELIFKSYKYASNQNLGKLATLKELNWKPYQEFILSIENTIPLDRKMITPQDLSEAKELYMVYSNYSNQ